MAIILCLHSIHFHILFSQLLVHLALIHSKVIISQSLNYLIYLSQTKRKAAVILFQFHSTALFPQLLNSLQKLRACQLHLSIFHINLIINLILLSTKKLLFLLFLLQPQLMTIRLNLKATATAAMVDRYSCLLWDRINTTTLNISNCRH